MTFAIATLFAAGTWLAATPEATPERGLALDASLLLSRVADFQPEQQALQREFSYLEKTTEEHRRKDGTINKTKTRTYTVSPSPDGEYRRLVRKDGAPLSTKAERDEENKLEKYLRKQQRLSVKERQKQTDKLTKRIERFQSRIRQAVEVFDFSEGTQELINSVPVATFRFTPKPDYRASSRTTKLLAKLEGTISIDPVRNQIARIEILSRENMNFLGGVFGRVSKGSAATATAGLDGDVWLLERIDVTLNARFYFLKRYRRNLSFVYSDYQRFSVETQERLGLPADKPAHR